MTLRGNILSVTQHMPEVRKDLLRIIENKGDIPWDIAVKGMFNSRHAKRLSETIQYLEERYGSSGAPRDWELADKLDRIQRRYEKDTVIRSPEHSQDYEGSYGDNLDIHRSEVEPELMPYEPFYPCEPYDPYVPYEPYTGEDARVKRRPSGFFDQMAAPIVDALNLFRRLVP